MMLLEGRRERCGGRKTLRGSNKEKKSTEWLGDSLETTTKKKKPSRSRLRLLVRLSFSLPDLTSPHASVDAAGV
jgi:hypothetical protein